jgi:hypothetical protein
MITYYRAEKGAISKHSARKTGTKKAAPNGDGRSKRK